MYKLFLFTIIFCLYSTNLISGQNEGIDIVTIVAISDTHEKETELSIDPNFMPKGDILIHAGDITNYGNRTHAIKKFNKWLGTLGYPKENILVISGNHEDPHYIEGNIANLLTNATYLDAKGKTVQVMGLKIFGASWNFDEESDTLNWKKDTDIVITHEGPEGIGMSSSLRSYAIKNYIKFRPPKIHIFGHNPPGYGIYQKSYGKKGETVHINAHTLDNNGQLNQPIVLEIKMQKDILKKIKITQKELIRKDHLIPAK